MLNSGTLSPNPGIYRFSARMIVYTEVTCTEDKAPQGCDPSADARAGMARGGLPAAPNSNPRLPRAIAYCRPKMVLTMGSTLLGGSAARRTTPELLFLETKWSSLMSYGLTAELLEKVLPMDSPLHPSTIREHVCQVAERLEEELGDEQFCFIEGCQRDWTQLPQPDGPLTVGIDGGYIRGGNKEGCFEVIAGKSLLSFRRERQGEETLSSKCFAWVQTYDEKPKRRLFEALRSQGMQMNQQIDFLSDGGEDVRNVQLYLNPEAEHLLDWFHVTMRLTVLTQMGKGVPEKIDVGDEPYELRSPVLTQLESIKWYLWHGNVFQALHRLQDLEMDLDAAAFDSKNETLRKLLKGVEELHTYVERNQNFIPNYGERYRNGERIASGFVESAVNQVMSKRMNKRQQMQWTARCTSIAADTDTSAQ